MMLFSASLKGAPDSSSVPPRHRRRPPPTLRTKSGCLTCRKRRKKCDERKPLCNGCERNHVDCVWSKVESPVKIQDKSRPAASSRSSSCVSTDIVASPSASPTSSESSLYIISDSSDHEIMPYRNPEHHKFGDILNYLSINDCHNGPRNFPDETTYSLLCHFSREVAPQLMHQHASSCYRDFSYHFSLIMSSPQLLDAFSACAALDLSSTRSEYLPVALKHYNRAISTMRSMIESNSVDGSEDWLLIMITLLTLVERWRSDAPSRALQHMAAAIKLFRIRRSKIRISSSAVLERACAESVAYHSATAVWSMDSMIDQSLFHDLLQFCHESAFMDMPECLPSPVLGLPFSFFGLLLRIEKMVRSDRSNLDMIAVLCALEEVDSFEEHCKPISEVENQNDRFLGSKLYIIAARIRLLELMSDTTSMSDEIAIQVKEGLVLFEFIDLPTPFSRYYAWPGMVIGCSIQKASDMRFLNTKIERVSGCGYVTKAIETVSAVWWDKSHPPAIQKSTGEV